VDWAALERCRHDYSIERVHFEQAQIIEQFGDLTGDSHFRNLISDAPNVQTLNDREHQALGVKIFIDRPGGWPWLAR